MKELLEKLAKGETTVDEVLAQIEDDKNGMVPRSRLNDKIADIKDLEAELKRREDDIVKLKSAAGDGQTLKDDLQRLMDANQEWEKKYAQTQLNNAIKLAVAKDANDPNDILYFIQKDNLKLQDDGTVQGLDDAVKQLRESKAYLFAQKEEEPEGPSGLNGRPPNGGGGHKPGAYTKPNPFKRDSFNLTEQARLMKENPDLAKKLKAQA